MENFKNKVLQILVVDDEEMIRRQLKRVLKEHQVEIVNCCSEAIIKAEKKQFDLALIDLILPDLNGIEFLKNLKALQPNCRCVIMTGDADISIAVEAIKAGAYNFIEKPFKLDALQQLITKMIKLNVSGLKNNDELNNILDIAAQTGINTFNSPKMNVLLLTAYKVAKKNFPVLIQGETGTGKELLARFIHITSTRANNKFIPVNCAALADGIVESELFGHEKGAFTGADRLHRGYFELADKGTLFLDEIGDSSLGFQSKLLRVLDRGEYQRVGGEGLLQVDTRIIAATNIDLESAIKIKAFRQDLFFRISTVMLTIPPLRGRKEDILPLSKHFLDKISEMHSVNKITISQQAGELLTRYSWPGNVRELLNVISQAFVLSDGNVLMPNHLPERLCNNNLISNDKNNCPPPSLKELEKQGIIDALTFSNGNVKQTAKILGISRATLHRKINDYGLEITHNISEKK